MTLHKLKLFYHWLSKPMLLHWIMPYLMALVVAGTVAQKYIGLYDSQRLFFSSFIFWIGFLPLPGGWTICALLLLSMSAKLIIASPWHKLTSGVFIAHLGVMLLLLGGLITAATSIEGYVALSPNETSHGFYDYHQRDLTISKNDVPVLVIPFSNLAKAQTIHDQALPFTLTINDLCRNCTMAMRDETDNSFKGPAQKVKLSALAGYMEDERNLAGVEFTISSTDADAKGTYIAFEPIEKQPGFMIGKDIYRISMGHKHYDLPFTLQLLNAEKELHPGTDVPRSYTSTVMLSDGTIHQRAVLTMNHPLRYKGYTVYQASFNGENSDVKTVSFAIVRNSGRVFPYVASVTLCLGLLIHLSMRLPALLKRKEEANAA